MPERPILFSAPMVRALLAGTKTQTRRTLKPQPQADFISARIDASGALTLCPAALAFSPTHKALRRLHKPGDRLWVREAWGWYCGKPSEEEFRAGVPVFYRADPNSSERYGVDWRPSIHMPRWASRLTLVVTDVLVQRLQDISDMDAVAEGYPGRSLDGAWTPVGAALYADGCDAIHWYRELWNSINGPGSWAANPWIAAYSFEVHQQNIDALLQIEERKAGGEG